MIGTFSKALGAFGGFVASSETVRDYLINRCAGVIYSTALPPPVLGAIDAALELVPGMDAERAHVASLAERFRAGAGAAGLDTGASTTQIVPIVVGTPEAALAMSGRLRQAGLWASSIRPPTVPPGTARLRLAFTAAHQETDVDRLLDVLAAERRAPPGAGRCEAPRCISCSSMAGASMPESGLTSSASLMEQASR